MASVPASGYCWDGILRTVSTLFQVPVQSWKNFLREEEKYSTFSLSRALVTQQCAHLWDLGTSLCQELLNPSFPYSAELIELCPLLCSKLKRGAERSSPHLPTHQEPLALPPTPRIFLRHYWVNQRRKMLEKTL